LATEDTEDTEQMFFVKIQTPGFLRRVLCVLCG